MKFARRILIILFNICVFITGIVLVLFTPIVGAWSVGVYQGPEIQKLIYVGFFIFIFYQGVLLIRFSTRDLDKK